MPRYSELEDLGSQLATTRLSSLTLANLVKEHVDLQSALGVSDRFAETIRSAYEEVQGTGSGDLIDLLQLLCCLHACQMCCEACCESTRSSSRQDHKRYSFAEVPPQEVMHDAAPSNEVHPTSWLERFAELSSEDLRQMVHSKSFGKFEKFGEYLFKKKFGEEETEHLKKCVETAKKVGPDLLQKDQLGIDDLMNKTKHGDSRAFFKMMRVVGTALMAKHGQSIHDKGLDALGLESCASVLCAGNMKYELDSTGLQKCVWACPKDHIPDTFQAISLEIPADAENETVTASMKESEKSGEDVVKDADLDPKQYEKSKTAKSWTSMHFHFHPAYTEAPLKLLQGTSPTELGNGIPLAFRYHGKCRPTGFELHERVVFTGSNENIPQGQLVKIERLPGTSWLKKKLAKDELEVKYQGKAYTVKQADLHREALAKIKVNEGVQEWMHSTGDTIQLSLPALHDPSHKQMKETLWFPVSSAKDEKEKQA